MYLRMKKILHRIDQLYIIVKLNQKFNHPNRINRILGASKI